MRDTNGKTNPEFCYKHYNDDVEYINKLVGLLYGDLGECCGGMLHIVLDDGNVGNSSIQFCIEQCNKEENQNRNDRFICLEIATKMLKLSEEQRRLIYYTDFGFCCEGDCSKCVIEHEEVW